MSNNSLKPPGADLKRVNSYTWPAGHVGQLSDSQSKALEDFKTLCKEKSYYEPANPTTKTPASHDDETLLRYLRARKFIPKDAFSQFKTTEDWRKENQLDSLYEGIDIQEYEQTRRLYPQWTGRRDNRGIPVYVFEVANVKYKDIAAQEQEKGKNAKSKTPMKMLRLFALYENLCRFVLPLCSVLPNRPNPSTPVSQSSNIVDIQKVGLKQFWNLRSHLQDSSALATAHYPETLDRIFVIGAPSFFPTIWDWIKNWFDPITVAKIQIVPDAKRLEVLSRFIPVENIPVKYGGKLEWQFGDMPFLDDSIIEAMRWKEDIKENGHRTFPIGPIKWEYDGDGDLVAVGVGSENGAPRKMVLAGLHPEAGVARLALSPGRQTAKHGELFAAVSGQGGSAAKTEPTSEKTEPSSEKTEEPNGEAKTPATMAPTGDGAADAPKDQQATITEKAATHSGGEFSTQAAPKLAAATTGFNPDTANNLPNSSLPETSRAGTYTVPYHNKEVSSPPTDSRQGTSASRFEQQEGTHAEGQAEHGTPNTKVDGQGSGVSAVETGTVGQAPKVTEEVEEESGGGPGYLEQAQALAGQAVESVKAVPAVVLGAVGLGGKEEEEEGKEGEGDGEKKEDSRVDELDDRIVEEFVRNQTMSKQRIGDRPIDKLVD